MNKKCYVIGGGTVAHITNHFATCSPAYGGTAKAISRMVQNSNLCTSLDVDLILTKMAGGEEIETNEDVANWVDKIKKDLDTKIVFFNCALVDFEPRKLNLFSTENRTLENIMENDSIYHFGKHVTRLESRNKHLVLSLKPSEKIISSIRKDRKDIFLVGFKATCGDTKQEMFLKGLRLCKEASCNLVLVNDTKTRWNMIITPEEAAYHETDNREEVLKNLVEMTLLRSNLTFTQSTVIAGDLIPWSSELIPDSLRKAVDYCIKGNAYKPFNGSTVGHFAVKLSDTEFLTSVRKSNFNDLAKNGMVKIKTDGPDTVLAYGAKPSVGGQSQRIVFKDHPGMDCILHFHSPLKMTANKDIPIATQRAYECGSHECGKNTSNHLATFGNLKAVMLQDHGPNIVFNKNIDPKELIDFIQANFELTAKTGGYTV